VISSAWHDVIVGDHDAGRIDDEAGAEELSGAARDWACRHRLAAAVLEKLLEELFEGELAEAAARLLSAAAAATARLHLLRGRMLTTASITSRQRRRCFPDRVRRSASKARERDRAAAIADNRLPKACARTVSRRHGVKSLGKLLFESASTPKRTQGRVLRQYLLDDETYSISQNLLD